MFRCTWLADGGAKGSNKILAVDLDEAAPSVGTTVALLGHQLEHLWSFTGKKKQKHCRMLSFGHSVLKVKIGWV